MRAADEIRNICIEYAKNRRLPHDHLTNELCWYRYEKDIKKVLPSLPENAYVLEIGCGFGIVSSLLAALRPDLKVYAIDITKDHISLWRTLKKYRGFFINGSAIDLPFPNNSFDVVISFGVMEHVGNDNKFLSEIYRVLKAGGINFMFNLPNRYGFTESFGVRFAFMLGKRFYSHETRYSKAYVKACLEKCDFKEIKINYKNILPSQFSYFSNTIGVFMNKFYKFIDKVDEILLKTPLCLLAQSMNIRCEK